MDQQGRLMIHGQGRIRVLEMGASPVLWRLAASEAGERCTRDPRRGRRSEMRGGVGGCRGFCEKEEPTFQGKEARNLVECQWRGSTMRSLLLSNERPRPRPAGHSGCLPLSKFVTPSRRSAFVVAGSPTLHAGTYDRGSDRRKSHASAHTGQLLRR